MSAMPVRCGQAALRLAKAGGSEATKAFGGRRHGSSWSHGGVVQQAAQRSRAENVDKAVAAFARAHNVEIPQQMRQAKAASQEGGGRGAARGVAGLLAVGGLMGGLIVWINEEVKHKPNDSYVAVKKVVRRVSQMSIGL